MRSYMKNDRYFLFPIIILLLTLLLGSCKEYEFISPYDMKNNLAAPAGLSMMFQADTAVTLNWQFVFVEDFRYIFEIEMSEDGSNYSLVQLIKENIKTITISQIFLVGKEYHFRVRARVDENVSGYSNVAKKLITFNPPGIVTAQLPTDTAAIIQWQDNAEIETGYEIFMSIDGGVSELVKVLPANATQTEYLSDFYTGKTYTFSVRAKSRANGVTPNSSAYAQFNLMQVTGLSVEILDTASAKLSWSITNGYAREIIIEQSLDGVNYTFLKNVLPSITNTIVNNYNHYSTEHFFRIRTNCKNNIGIYASGSGLSPFFCGVSIVLYEGKTYNTVQIGDQCWLKENLNVGEYVASVNTGPSHSDVSNNGIKEKYCYNNDTANCNIYGGLYDWNEAMQYVTTSGTQGICPPGWHIPTRSEFQILSVSLGGNSNDLKAVGQGIAGGIGTNTSGFTALLAGLRGYDGAFGGIHYSTSFWCSDRYNPSYIFYMVIYNDNNGIYIYETWFTHGFSVRCVKD